MKFLRAGRYDIDYATEILTNYIGSSHDSGKYFAQSTNMDLMRQIYEAQIYTMLQHRDKHGRRVFIFRPGQWDPDTISVEDLFCAGILLCEMAAKEPMSQVCGCIVIDDWENCGLKQIVAMNKLEHLKFFSKFMQVIFISPFL